MIIGVFIIGVIVFFFLILNTGDGHEMSHTIEKDDEDLELMEDEILILLDEEDEEET